MSLMRGQFGFHQNDRRPSIVLTGGPLCQLVFFTAPKPFVQFFNPSNAARTRIGGPRFSCLYVLLLYTLAFMRFSLYLPALLIVVGGNALAQAPQYSVTDLGTLGGVSSFGTAINDLGQVTGDSLTSTGVEHAFFYDGTMHDLGTLNNADAGSISRAWGINNQGQVVGTSNVTLAGSPFAFVYSMGSMHSLAGLGRSQAFDINDSGQISGVNLMTSEGFCGTTAVLIAWEPPVP